MTSSEGAMAVSLLNLIFSICYFASFTLTIVISSYMLTFENRDDINLMDE